MIITSPYATEKTLTLIDYENSLQFKVRKDARKGEIKKEVERLFDVEVEKVTIKIGRKGKIATVKLTPEHLASEVATRIGVM